MSHKWLEFMSHLNGCYTQHKYNKKLEQHDLSVDGCCMPSMTVYQFNGSVFHRHGGEETCPCQKTGNMKMNPINKYISDLHVDTKLKELYIKSRGYNLDTIYKCEWEEYKKGPFYCRNFVKAHFIREMKIYKSILSEQEIVDAIRKALFNGFVECDLHVSDHLKQKFSKMPLIF